MKPQSRSNDDQTQYWNGPESSHWLVHEHRYERMLAPFTRLVLGAAAVARTDRVLDVGFEHGDAQTHRLAPGGFDVASAASG